MDPAQADEHLRGSRNHILKLFTSSTKDVDEWALIKAGNILMSLVLNAVSTRPIRN
jgi:hypothetical protein